MSAGSPARWVREQSLSLFFGALFLFTLVGQALAGWHQFNDQQLADGMGRLSLGQYLTSADFAVDVTENWQSEYLQFLVFLVAGIWLFQKGSTESKKLDRPGLESDEDQEVGPHAADDSPPWAAAGGWRTGVFSSSLTLMMSAIFLVSWLAQSVAGWAAFNETRLAQLQDPITWGQYLLDADFWARTLQNWQSEFLAVGSMVILSVYLRQRGSAQSKPVGAAHEETADEG
ncbi:DUF6766 family protein [Nocardioides sp. NPDC092400]|uniref:DUF6766 family protein n=1 Tax=Nocardioides sp. NPDC092400 TaxID=3155196 RepID=UPI0034310CB2